MSGWRPLAPEYTERATKELLRLDRREARRVREGIVRYAETGQGDVKRLQGSEGYRLRVGNYRVRFTIERGEIRVMMILRVAHRREAYRR